ncbi:MAG: DUF2851 family protein [Limisphaerales bacterium]
MSLPERVYLGWRNSSEPQLQLKESLRQGTPPERWLQEIWAHQRIRREHLATSTGEPVRILHPGFLNREAGPDFLKAVVQRGDSAPTTGDIEIDLRPSGWKSHGHFQNPAYANVVLHVTWDPPGPEPLLPTLVLQDVLDAPIEDLLDWVDGNVDLPSPWVAGQCSAAIRSFPPEWIADLLHQAALVRLTTKARAFGARGRDAGWTQALREGVFRGLGYKHNAWPMQRLAEVIPHLDPIPSDTREPRDAWEARLLGLAGLLPPEPKSGTRARLLWDLWWRERDSLQPLSLPPFLWRLHGVRPANHPQRRLAVAAAWIADPAWEPRMNAWFEDLVAGGPAADNPEATLNEALRPESHGFWRRHYTLSTRALPSPAPLLGSGRLNDLAVNAFLPWLWARADSVGDETHRRKIESVFLHWPPGEDNATLKLARARIFGTDNLPVRKTAAVQQGLLQIVRDYCLHSDSICSGCALPGCFNQFLSSVAEGFSSRSAGDGA